jgi:hypothetical protein
MQALARQQPKMCPFWRILALDRGVEFPVSAASVAEFVTATGRVSQSDNTGNPVRQKFHLK